MIRLLLALVLWVVTLGANGRIFLGKQIKKLFWITASLFFILDAFLLWRQYRLWSTDKLGQFFLPEHQVSYFLWYSIRTFAPNIIALLTALLLIYLTTKLNLKRNRMLFENEEPYLAGLSVLLVGYPGWLIFIVFLLLTYLLWQLIVALRFRKSNLRLPLYNLWPLLVGATIIFIELYLKQIDFWKFLQV